MSQSLQSSLSPKKKSLNSPDSGFEAGFGALEHPRTLSTIRSACLLWKQPESYHVFPLKAVWKQVFWGELWIHATVHVSCGPQCWFEIAS